MTQQLFTFEEGAALTAFMQEGQPWFIAADVCGALGLDPTATRRLDDDEKGLRTVQTLGGLQRVAIVSESGLYALIFKSRKEGARRFQKWVTSIVLPSIRQHGGYITGMEALNAADKAETVQAIQTEAERTRERHEQYKLDRYEAHQMFRRLRR